MWCITALATLALDVRPGRRPPSWVSRARRSFSPEAAAGARARSPTSDGESSGVERYTRSFRGIVPAARELLVRRIL